MPISMADAEQLKRMIVEPTVALVKQDIEAVGDKITETHALLQTHISEMHDETQNIKDAAFAISARVQNLESLRLKLFAAAAFAGLVAGGLIRAGWEVATWIFRKN